MLPDGYVTPSVQVADLQQLGFSDSVITQICSFLTSSATDLTDSKPDAVGHSSFGSAPASVACSTDAGKARTVVIEAITDMVAGLHGYRDAIHGLARKTTNVDQQAQVAGVTLVQQAASCEAPPTFGSPSQCSLPGSSQDGGQ